MPRLKSSKSYCYCDPKTGARYVIAYDHRAGHKNRFTVLRYDYQTEFSNQAEVIGRELDLQTARKVVARRVS